MPDAAVVGSGPNGLAAAVRLAQAGLSVTVYEAAETVGGGARTAELTLPGYLHDVCSSIHPFGPGSPFLGDLSLEQHGLEWLPPPLPLAHPLDGGDAIALPREAGEIGAALGQDAAAWRRLVLPHSRRWERIAPDILGPLNRWPSDPVGLARFGVPALAPATWLARAALRTDGARALFAGLAAHATIPPDRPLTSASALVLGATAHTTGWPVARGGSGAVSAALASCLRDLGGHIVTGRPVGALDDLPRAGAYLLDTSPAAAAAIAGDRLSPGTSGKLTGFRHGPGVFKVDYALSGPIPWTAEVCRRAGTVHVGGSAAEILESERAVASGRVHSRPFLIVTQPSVADPSRAPGGHHTAWAYCHVPNGWTGDALPAIEAQLERFAPGFRTAVLARHVTSPAGLAAYNANYVGGDISGGSYEGLRLVARPWLTWNPYRLAEGVYLCSASTPPGPGVHGMCGYWAATAALGDLDA